MKYERYKESQIKTLFSKNISILFYMILSYFCLLFLFIIIYPSNKFKHVINCLILKFPK